MYMVILMLFIEKSSSEAFSRNNLSDDFSLSLNSANQSSDTTAQNFPFWRPAADAFKASPDTWLGKRAQAEDYKRALRHTTFTLSESYRYLGKIDQTLAFFNEFTVIRVNEQTKYQLTTNRARLTNDIIPTLTTLQNEMTSKSSADYALQVNADKTQISSIKKQLKELKPRNLHNNAMSIEHNNGAKSYVILPENGWPK